MNFAKLTDGRQSYYYRAHWKQSSNAKEHEFDCGPSTCTADGLSQAEAYDMRVRACFAPHPGNSYEVCGQFSPPTTEYTLPLGESKAVLKFVLVRGYYNDVNMFTSEPEIPSIASRTASKIVLTFKELTDGAKVYFYKLEAKGSDADLHDCTCNTVEHSCHLDGLKAARSYEIALRACFSPVANRDVCSLPKGTVLAWTLPEGIL